VSLIVHRPAGAGMSSVVWKVSRLLLILTLLGLAVGKLVDGRISLSSGTGLGVELVLGGALTVRRGIRPAAWGVLLLSVGFGLMASLDALEIASTPRCGCFGVFMDAPPVSLRLGSSALLAGLSSVLILIEPRDPCGSGG